MNEPDHPTVPVAFQLLDLACTHGLKHLPEQRRLAPQLERNARDDCGIRRHDAGVRARPMICQEYFTDGIWRTELGPGVRLQDPRSRSEEPHAKHWERSSRFSACCCRSEQFEPPLGRETAPTEAYAPVFFRFFEKQRIPKN
jgi:hypothetical protein